MGYFLYVRKSEEDDGRQVQSIGDQLKIGLELADNSNLTILEVFEKARSAKRPGRPVFNEMIARIEAGEADGILTGSLATPLMPEFSSTCSTGASCTI